MATPWLASAGLPKLEGPKSHLRSAVSVGLKVLFAIAVWEILIRMLDVPRQLAPSSFKVVRALGQLFRDENFAYHIAISTLRAIFALSIAIVVGVTSGSVTGFFPRLDRAFGWIFQVARAFPPVALVPLAVVWIGIGTNAKIAVIAWGAFFPIWLNTHLGVRGIDKRLLWSGRSLGVDGISLLKRVALPAALPYVIAGIRLGTSAAFICVYVAETTGAFDGIGFVLYKNYQVFRVDRLLACMATLGLLAATIDVVLRRLVLRIFPWLALAQANP